VRLLPQALPNISNAEVALRLSLAVVLCAAIGIEREVRGQAAGLRTHILVGLGSALFTLVSAYGFHDFVRPVSNGAGANVPYTLVDPSRIAAQIVSGIGFLGAGAIIRQGPTIRGLTTAAALWIAAAIGMAAAAGFYFGALVATLIVMVALVGFRQLRPWLFVRLRSDIAFLDLELATEKRLGQVLAILAAHEINVESLQNEHSEKLSFRLELRVPAGVELGRIETEIGELEGVNLVGLQAGRAG
jgi:putative Mg2+ transporter-C (MgtC) family protein